MTHYNNITAAEARNLTVYTFNKNGAYPVSLYDHVMKSLDNTTTPRGIMPDLFVEEHGNGYAVKSWILGDNFSPRIICEFNTKEEAENHIFRIVFTFDFQEDDQRITSFYTTEAEASAAFAYTY